MELGNAAMEELQNSVSCAPITPDKCLNKFVLVNSSGAEADMELDNAAKEERENSVSCAPIASNKCLNKFVLVNSSGNSKKMDDTRLAAIEGRAKVLNENLDFDSMVPLTPPPQKAPPQKAPPHKANPKRKQSDNSDLNDGPHKKRKKITPKIFDESKPKKILKPKNNSSIPKPAKPNASIKAKRNTKNDMYNDSKEILEHSILETSPSEFEHPGHVVKTCKRHEVKSCKRALDFNLENHDVEDLRHTADSLDKFMANDDVNKLLVDINCAPVDQPLVRDLVEADLVVLNDRSMISTENNLETESTSQANRGNRSNYGVRQPTFLKVYKRRTKSNIAITSMVRGKSSIDAMSLAGNGKSSIDAMSLAGNEECEFLKNSRKLTLNFPIPCKRKRTTRQKTRVHDFLTANYTGSNLNTTCKVTSRSKRIHGRSGANKATKRRFTVSKRTKNRRANGAQKRSFTYATRATKISFTYATRATERCLSLWRKEKLNPHFVQEVLPTKFQVASAMANPELFKCVFALSPVLKSRKKRSLCPKRTKYLCEEAKTDLAKRTKSVCEEAKTDLAKRSKSVCEEAKTDLALSFALTLPPLVISKKKRSTNGKLSTVVLDSIPLKNGIPMHEGSCYDTKGFSMHEGSGYDTEFGEKSPRVLCSQPTMPQASVADSMTCACISNPLCSGSELDVSNGDESIWNVIPRHPQHKKLWPRGSTKSLASLTRKLRKLQISDNRTYRGTGMSMKKNVENCRQLVLRNHFGPIVANKEEKKPKAKLPKVDIDAESLRVWKLLTENEGEVDDDLDKEKEIWWEEQRKIFQGRVDSFIARMRLVLGDRRFSQWNGSVVDSVVGVYLTQNVSDHLSSNAFMLLASAFPPKPKQELTTREGQALPIQRLHGGTQEVKDSEGDDTCGNEVRATPCGSVVSEKIKLSKTISREKHKEKTDWDELRKTYSTGKSRVVTEKNRDSVDWEAVRHANIEKIIEPIRGRGQYSELATKIQNFLNRMVEDHGSTDLEWLRDVPSEKVKEYLLSIFGLGPKSVDCLRLLTLRHVAFPVDINVARVAVRLGWVPLQPLPDSLQMHLLEKYPLESSIQKYLWPRLCKLDVLTLYELHYHMITFGKVFCTKKSPNCNACPLRADCRHFASAFASARLRLPAPQQQGVVDVNQPVGFDKPPNMSVPSPILSLSSGGLSEATCMTQTQSCEPIIEMPPSPCQDLVVRDIEDFPCEVVDEQEIPTIRFNTEDFRENVLDFIKNSNSKEFHGVEEVSKALVLLSPEAASFPAPKLKNESRLRTEHVVYELPNSHPLLIGFENRDANDDVPYLLSIFRTDEVMKNQKNFSSTESGLCGTEICLSSASYDQNDQIVYGTILIPCRTANRGSFPLNGTYFQVNEVFADHKSSQCLIPVPRASIWNLTQAPLLCGTSIKTIFKGMSTMDIQYGFWNGYVCVRGYDREQRAPKPLHKRFHSGGKK